MSFSSLTKEALCKLKIKSAEERRALIFAATACIGTIVLTKKNGIGIKYLSETHSVTKLLAKTASAEFDVVSELLVYRASGGVSENGSVLSVFGKAVMDILTLSGVMGASSEADFIRSEILKNEAAKKAYVRGAFLACGSVSDPNKAYHAELVCRNQQTAAFIAECCRDFSVPQKLTKRKDQFILYMKSCEAVSDFLKLIGAVNSTMELENTRLIKDIRNNANRSANCEFANIRKSTRAVSKQIHACKLILEEYPNLPEHLKLTAKARVLHNEASLSELAEILGMGKSGVNHRLQKIIEMANEIGNEEL